MNDEVFDPLRPGFNLSEAREHVSDIMFDPQCSPDPECIVCKVAVGLGLWREFGVDDPFSDSYEASLPTMDEVRSETSGQEEQAE